MELHDLWWNYENTPIIGRVNVMSRHLICQKSIFKCITIRLIIDIYVMSIIIKHYLSLFQSRFYTKEICKFQKFWLFCFQKGQVILSSAERGMTFRKAMCVAAFYEVHILKSEEFKSTNKSRIFKWDWWFWNSTNFITLAFMV